MQTKKTIIAYVCDICGEELNHRSRWKELEDIDEDVVDRTCDICKGHFCYEHSIASDEEEFAICNPCKKKGYRIIETEEGPIIKLKRKVILRW
jgi:hypothetical protein